MRSKQRGRKYIINSLLPVWFLNAQNGGGWVLTVELGTDLCNHRCRSDDLGKTVFMNILFARLAAAGALVATLAACAVGPDYQRPSLNVPSAFKQAEAGGALWQPAAVRPVDSARWWTVYDDEVLNGLMDKLNRQNFSIAEAEARYRSAAAAVRQAEAGFYPTVGADASRSRSRANSNGEAVYGTVDAAGLSVSWLPDLWGSVRRQTEAGRASADAAAAALAAAKLAAQAQLADAYLKLVVADRQLAALQQNVKDTKQFLQLTQNQYRAGIADQSTVEQANSQLKTLQAQQAALHLSRAQLEHAIAAALGEAPAAFSLDSRHEEVGLPQIPAGLPSGLLQRRPDIAEAEREVVAANAQIGVAQAAYFPSLTLGGSIGFRGSSFADLLNLPNLVWSVGPQLAATLFDGGQRRAATAQARADYEAAVAAYRQTVITAFQEVEDNLAAQRRLAEQARYQGEALESARKAETIMMNQYKAGVASYLQVLTARSSRLSAESSWWSVKSSQYSASVSLIAALGGSIPAEDSSSR